MFTGQARRAVILYFSLWQTESKRVKICNSLTLTPAQRSALTYNDDFNILRRNIGISTASTTSRSTCKTSSSPYSRGERAAAGPRGVGASSSTPSNYNSNTDLNSQSVKSPYAYNDSTTFHRKHSEFRLTCTLPFLVYYWRLVTERMVVWVTQLLKQLQVYNIIRKNNPQYSYIWRIALENWIMLQWVPKSSNGL